MARQFKHGEIGLFHYVLLVGLLVAVLVVPLELSECRMENLLDRYNCAIEKGRLDEARCLTVIAAILHPREKVLVNQMRYLTKYAEQHPDGFNDSDFVNASGTPF
jgi:hypothetical protein